MMSKKQNKADEITASELIQYFNSELNDKDEERVLSWIARSEENKEVANDVYTVVLANDVLHTIDGLSPYEALKRVNRRIASSKIRLYGKWLQRAAAVMFVPLFLLTAYLLIKNAKTDQEYISFRTNPGMVADFNLPDGTKVWLNAHSTITFPAQFKQDRREVQLSGEAYFQVIKDEKHPFIVNLNNGVEVEVTGTEFNVDSYERSKVITTMLVSGGVNITKGERRIALESGQKIIIEKETGKVSMLYASPLVETGWKDGKVFLENTPLEDLLYTLSKRFDVDFVLENDKLKDNYFTGTFGTQDLDLVLKHLEFSSGIKHKIKMPANNDVEVRTRITLY